MPSNLKNRSRAESAIGVTNADMSRTIAQADPRFCAEAEEELHESEPTGLSVSGPSTNAKVVATTPSLSSTLPGYPKNPHVFEVTGRKRT